MATTKKTRTRIAPAAAPSSQVIAGLTKDLATKASKAPAQDPTPGDDDPLVMTTVPKAFTLTLDNGTSKHYEAGANKMPKSHADHWYAKAHGTKIAD